MFFLTFEVYLHNLYSMTKSILIKSIPEVLHYEFKLWCVKTGVSMQSVLETMIREQTHQPLGTVYRVKIKDMRRIEEV